MEAAPESEIIRLDRPELAIIPPDEWAASQSGAMVGLWLIEGAASVPTRPRAGRLSNRWQVDRAVQVDDSKGCAALATRPLLSRERRLSAD
jgi:hypothetical protein